MTSTVARDSALLAIANRLHYVLLAGDDDRAIEAFALRIHQYGPHSDGPFVTMNAAVLPPILAEAELRSHVLGPFPGRRQGRLERAHGGTLFLSRIEALDVAAHRHLLHMIDHREATPMGAEDEPYQVTARLIVTTSEDLAAAVRAGRFRRDLYERLAATVVTVPTAAR
jgi:two-component system response regulator HydG